MRCEDCPESKVILGEDGPSWMVPDPNSETCKDCMDELLDGIMDRHKESLDMLAKDDGTVLKPCPFCGSRDVGLHHFGDGFLDTVMVECNDCGVSMHSKDYELDEKDAIELWNRRVKE